MHYIIVFFQVFYTCAGSFLFVFAGELGHGLGQHWGDLRWSSGAKTAQGDETIKSGGFWLTNLWKLDEIGYLAVKNNLQRVISPSNILIQPWQNHWFIGGDAEHPAKQSLVWGEKQNDTWLCLFLEFPLHISLRPRSVSAPGVCLSVYLPI